MSESAEDRTAQPSMLARAEEIQKQIQRFPGEISNSGPSEF